MSIPRGFLILLVGGGLVLFTVQNLAPAIPLVFLGGKTPALPVAVWVLGAVAAGAGTILLINGMPAVPQGTSSWRKRSRQRRESRGSRFSAAESSASTSSSVGREPDQGGNYNPAEFGDWDQSQGRSMENWDDWAAYKAPDKSGSGEPAYAQSYGGDSSYANESTEYIDFERPEYWEGGTPDREPPYDQYQYDSAVPNSTYDNGAYSDSGYVDSRYSHGDVADSNGQNLQDMQPDPQMMDPSGYTYGDQRAENAEDFSSDPYRPGQEYSTAYGETNPDMAAPQESPSSWRDQIAQNMPFGKKESRKVAAGEAQPIYDADYRVIVPPPPGSSEEDEDWGLDDWGLDNDDDPKPQS